MEKQSSKDSKNKADGSDSKAKKDECVLLKPLTVNNILYYYSPIIGTGSYYLLSINVLNPALRLG